MKSPNSLPRGSVLRRCLSLLAPLLFLAACNAGAGDPAAVVERYLQAKIDGDRQAMQSLLCADMEAVLEREVRTFDTVSGVRLENVTCSRVAASETVQCEGAIVALYGAEEVVFPLVTYRVIQEDGEWKWCGETS